MSFTPLQSQDLLALLFTTPDKTGDPLRGIIESIPSGFPPLSFSRGSSTYYATPPLSFPPCSARVLKERVRHVYFLPTLFTGKGNWGIDNISLILLLFVVFYVLLFPNGGRGGSPLNSSPLLTFLPSQVLVPWSPEFFCEIPPRETHSESGKSRVRFFC